MDGKFEFCGKQFQYPEDVPNERAAAVYKTLKGTGDEPWWSEDDVRSKMMRLLLDGPHDEIDWAKASFPLCLTVYNGFFPFYRKRIEESDNS